MAGSPILAGPIMGVPCDDLFRLPPRRSGAFLAVPGPRSLVGARPRHGGLRARWRRGGSALDRARHRGLAPSIYTADLFRTDNDVDNRAVVAARPTEGLDLVGLAIHGPRKDVDKAVKGLALHG